MVAVPESVRLTLIDLIFNIAHVLNVAIQVAFLVADSTNPCSGTLPSMLRGSS